MYMKNVLLAAVAGLLFCCQSPRGQMSSPVNEEGWIALFDGSSVEQWRGVNTDSFPGKGWKVEDGQLIVLGGGGDIITKEQYADFHLKAEFKLTPGSNSGIKYFVQLYRDSLKNNFYALGLEYQLLDDDRHPDAKKGSHEGSRTLASLYDLIKAENKQPNPIGEWNQAEIISKGNHVEHWLNGRKVLEYERGSETFRQLVVGSKYKDIKNFGEHNQGYILLQDHGDTVYYRNIYIKKL